MKPDDSSKAPLQRVAQVAETQHADQPSLTKTLENIKRMCRAMEPSVLPALARMAQTRDRRRPAEALAPVPSAPISSRRNLSVIRWCSSNQAASG